LHYLWIIFHLLTSDCYPCELISFLIKENLPDFVRLLKFYKDLTSSLLAVQWLVNGYLYFHWLKLTIHSLFHFNLQLTRVQLEYFDTLHKFSSINHVLTWEVIWKGHSGHLTICFYQVKAMMTLIAIIISDFSPLTCWSKLTLVLWMSTPYFFPCVLSPTWYSMYSRCIFIFIQHHFQPEKLLFLSLLSQPSKW